MAAAASATTSMIAVQSSDGVWRPHMVEHGPYGRPVLTRHFLAAADRSHHPRFAVRDGKLVLSDEEAVVTRILIDAICNDEQAPEAVAADVSWTPPPPTHLMTVQLDCVEMVRIPCTANCTGILSLDVQRELLQRLARAMLPPPPRHPAILSA